MAASRLACAGGFHVWCKGAPHTVPPMSPLLSAEVMYSRLMGKARLRHLQLLVAIADESNLKRGAEDVFMSQPAATQALAELEHLLGVELFERHAKGMRLTPSGETLIPVLRQMLQALRDSTVSLESLQKGTHNLLRVGVISAAASAVLGEGVLRFCQRHQDVRVALTEGVQEQLVQQLQAGSLNLVIGRRMGLQQLHFDTLWPDEAVVISGPAHPLAGREALDLDELNEYPWMRPSRGLWVRGVFDDLFERAGLRPRLHPMSLGSVGPLIEVLRDQQTISMIPGTLGRMLCQWGLAVILDTRLDTPCGEMGVISMQGLKDDPIHEEFIAALRCPPQTAHRSFHGTAARTRP